MRQRPGRPPAELTLWAAALVALAVFAIDAFTAFDIAVAVFYVVVVLLVASTGSRGYVLAAAVGVAVLTVSGFLFSHWSSYALGAIGRCVVSLLAIGTTSILSLRHLANTTQLPRPHR